MVRRNRNINTVHPLTHHHHKPRALAASLPQGKQLFLKTVFLAALAYVLFLCFAANAAAQTNMLHDPEANQLYEQLLSNPTNRTLNLQYSALMSKGGDYEAAIPPLERILVTEPNNAWLMLQLGKLYFALKSNMMAASYLERAINEPTASSDIVDKAQKILNSM